MLHLSSKGDTMDWPQVLTISASLIGVILSMWFIQRENHRETKEFHGRLCALEEKYIQMMQRILERRK